MLSQFLATTCVAVLLAGSVQSQVTQVPGTGCRGAAYPTTVGSPAIGQGFGVHGVPCGPGDVPFLIIGRQPVNQPIRGTCGGAPCILYPSPDIVLRGSSAWRIVLPNDPRYIGVCFDVQSGCLDARAGCIALSGGLQVCITR